MNPYATLRKAKKLPEHIMWRWEIGRWTIVVQKFEFGSCWGHLNLNGPGFRHLFYAWRYKICVEGF